MPSKPFWLITLFFVLLLSHPGDSLAQQPTAPRKLRVVDEVALVDGGKMLGIVTSNDRTTGTEILVEREWFENTYPKKYADHFRHEVESDSKTRQDLLRRLEAWKSRRNAEIDTKLIAFIEREIERLSKNGDEKPQQIAKRLHAKQFTWVVYPSQKVRKVFAHGQMDRYRTANLGWANRIKGVSIRSVSAITKELTKRNVKTDAEFIDLSDQIPTKPMTDFEWNKRVCICEFVYRKPLHFQGTGSSYVKVDSESRNQQQDMMNQLMQTAGFESALKNLLDNPKARQNKSVIQLMRQATDEAERIGCRGVRITRLATNSNNAMVTVEDLFLAQMENGKWRVASQFEAKSDRNKIAAGDADFLKEDPQINQLISAFGEAGLANKSLLDKALRQGLATQRAMEDSGELFVDFLDRYSQRIDGPAFQ
ncbi:MAG: hypothetical protein AAF497_23175 [Planctomycetota bacterium]